MHRRECESGIADFCPKARNDDFISPVVLECIAYFLVIPGVHRRAFEDGRIGEHFQQFGIGVTRKAFCLDGSNGRRDTEHFRCLGQANDIVLQSLAVNRLNAEGHLWLLVDEDQL